MYFSLYVSNTSALQSHNFSHYIICGFNTIKTTVRSLSVAAICMCVVYICVFVCSIYMYICVYMYSIYTHDVNYESDFYKIILNHFIPNKFFLPILIMKKLTYTK